MKRPPNPQTTADAFNKKFAVGEEIEYASTLPLSEGDEWKRYKTRGEAFVLSGHTACVFLEGYSGCVAVTHIRKAGATR